MGWRVLHDKESLWARILQKKYKVGDIRDQSWLKVKSTWSSTWRSVGIGLREVILPGVRWNIGDGKNVKFWKDKWLSSEPLSDLVTGVNPPRMEEATVRELWRSGYGWDWQNISPFVSDQLRLQIASRVVDTVTGSSDRISWGACSDGKFSVKSAYSLLTRDMHLKQQMGGFFTRIWRATVPERLRVFFWLIGNQALMTNMKRQRRHLSDSGVCQVCKGGEETILHILRDCPAMSGVWARLVPPNQHRSFFEMTLLEWIYVNLGITTAVHGCLWATLFATATWWGWKWRCGNVFGSNQRCPDRVKFLKDKAMETATAYAKVRGDSPEFERVERLIHWVSPSGGWFKLNTDGASRGNPGLATAGGVVRDESGNWCDGFALNIGICSAPLAELWDVYYGLYIAWGLGITRLELEVDSEIVVGFLQTGIEDSHPLSFLVRLCYGFISKDWIVRISHVYREANRLADGLANYAFSLPLGFHSFYSCPDSGRFLVLDDVNGTAHPRFVRM